MSQFSRTEMLLGAKALNKLANSRVAVFGLGGVGGFVVEALARAGVGTLDLIDNDTISVSNINRQIIALHSTIGMAKVEAVRQRLLDINPDIKLNCHRCFFLPENADDFDFTEFDYVADAIDTVAGKIALVEKAVQANTAIICAMGAGNKLNPSMFKVADIANTSVCPLAKVMRKELRNRGINHFKVVYSEETPIKPLYSPDENNSKRQTAGSVSFVPSIVGLLMSGEIIKDLIKDI